MTHTYDFDKSTYENHREHLTVPFVEPAKSTQPTTHDIVSARTTINAPVRENS